MNLHLPTLRPAASVSMPMPARPLAQQPSARRYDRVAPSTGPFAALVGARRTVIVADVENWAYSARDLGRSIDFAALAQLLRQNLARAMLHGVLSVDARDVEATRLEGSARGWIAHPRAIFASATRRHANADTLFACAVTAIVAREKPDTVVLGTGDGALGLDVARFLRTAFPRCRRIATLSVAGATSHLLDAAREPAITANLEIGRDVMR